MSNTLPALRCLALLLVSKDTLVGGDEQRRGLGYIFAALASALASVVGRQPAENIKLSVCMVRKGPAESESPHSE